MSDAQRPPSTVPFTHRVIAAGTFFGVLAGFALFVALLGWLLVFVGGCAVGQTRPDASGTTRDVVGFDVGAVNGAAAGALSLGGLMSGNPAIVGLAALVAHQFGTRKGWDEKQSDDLKQRGIVATTEKM